MFCSCCAFGVDRVENGCREGKTRVIQQCFGFDITTIFHFSAIRISNVSYLSIDKFVNNSKKEKKRMKSKQICRNLLDTDAAVL
jgi:hypothetical protein